MKKISKSLIAMAMAIATIAGTCPLTTAVQIPQTAVAVATEENVFENKTFENPFTVEKALEAFNANGSYDEYISNALVYQNETADIYYVINEETNEATIVGLKAKASDVIVPEFISDEIGVFEILSLWNPETKLPDQNVKSIQMECTEDYRTSIQLIDSYAFSGFENLESIKFPAVRVRTRNSSETHSRNDDHYLMVNKYAFDGCYNLDEMVLPNAVEFETTKGNETWGIGYGSVHWKGDITKSEYKHFDEDIERYTSSRKGIKLTLVGGSGNSSRPTIAKDMIQLTDVVLSAGYCQEQFRSTYYTGNYQWLTLIEIENKINIFDEQIDEVYDSPVLNIYGCNIGEFNLKGYSYNPDVIKMELKIEACTIDEIYINKYFANCFVIPSNETKREKFRYDNIKKVYFEDDAILESGYSNWFAACKIDKVSVKSTAINSINFQQYIDGELVNTAYDKYDPWVDRLKSASGKEILYQEGIYEGEITDDYMYPYERYLSSSEKMERVYGLFEYCIIEYMEFREKTDFITTAFTMDCSIGNIKFPDKGEDMVIAPYAFCSHYEFNSNNSREFSNQTKMNVIIPDGTIYIGNNAFEGINIDTLFIPKSVVVCLDQDIVASNVIYEGINTLTRINSKFCKEEADDAATVIYGCKNEMEFKTEKGYSYLLLPANKLSERNKLKFVELHSGDINSDSEVTIADAVKMQRYLLGIDEISMGDCFAGDLTGDNTVDVFDMVLLRQKLVKSLGL